MRRQRVPIMALAAVLLVAACVTLKPGSDPVLVNAEKGLSISTDSLDALFKADYQLGSTIDANSSAWKGQVNALRLQAPPTLNAANAAVKAYRAALALFRADPTQITQAQLNALASDLGAKVVAAVELGQQAAKVAATAPGGVK